MRDTDVTRNAHVQSGMRSQTPHTNRRRVDVASEYRLAESFRSDGRGDLLLAEDGFSQ